MGIPSLPWLVVAVLVCSPAAFPWQQPQDPPDPQRAPGVLRVTTRLVLVDVVVTDGKGRPLTSLTLDDFVVLENGREQAITSFSLVQPSSPGAIPFPVSATPPSVYTNRYSATSPPGTLTILLLDSLNTPAEDQAYVRRQMFDFMATQLRSEQPMAVLALTKSLWMLQNFTSDPERLRAALDRYTAEHTPFLKRQEQKLKLPPELEAGLETSSLPGGDDLSSPLADATLEMLKQLEADVAAESIMERVRVTLGALRAVAQMTAGFPGRKNLIWVSAGFPFGLDPQINERFAASSGSPGQGSASFASEIRRTANLLTEARIAIYPVDARGLVGWSPDLAASRIDSPLLREDFPEGLPVEHRSADLLPRRGEVLSTHMAMEQLATETGGRVFKDRNDIDKAVAESISDGSTYYVVGYRPSNRKWDGRFRSIKVEVARKGVQVRHRRGYYALDAERSEERAEKAREDEIQAALTDPVPATGVTFQVEVPPPDPAPLARVQINYRIDTDTLIWQEVAGGAREAKLEFYVAAYTPGGEQVYGYGQTTESRLDAEEYERAARHGLAHQLGLELEPGSYRLRLVVRDARTGLLGRVDAPVEIDSLRRRR